eukprot:4370460-Alexandrium_andersonii.AAC.1
MGRCDRHDPRVIAGIELPHMATCLGLKEGGGAQLSLGIYSLRGFKTLTRRPIFGWPPRQSSGQ